MSEAGYKLDRDEDGLTAREREVVAGLREGKTFEAIGLGLGVSKQRVAQIANALVEKKVLIKQGRKYGFPLR